MRLPGTPLTLAEYPALTTTNPQFIGMDLSALDRMYLPPALTGLLDEDPLKLTTFIEDDNRGAVTADPVATIDGIRYHLSVKGIGSAVDPFSSRPLDASTALQLSGDPAVQAGLSHPRIQLPAGETDRVITGELWLRGSPYGGQGLEHASIAMEVARRAELTSIRGFRIAPVVKISHFPVRLENHLRTIHWYRRFPGHLAQEIRLVPSNVRVYFHARSTIGNNIREVFDLFGVDTNEQALQFETNYIRSSLAMLTLFARTMRYERDRDRFIGLDFHDVWLDKDAVLAPDGTVFFVDLEGIEEEAVPREGVREKILDQIYRSLYEFMFGYEQIEEERTRRFGVDGARKAHFEGLVTEAVQVDEVIHVLRGDSGTKIQVRNPQSDDDLYTEFPLVDR